MRQTNNEIKLGILTLATFAVITIFSLREIPEREIHDTVPHGFNITAARIISTEPESETTIDLAESIRRYIKIENTTIDTAINGSQALEDDVWDNIALYTRYLLVSGRHDHMQLSNPKMLGCFLSHVRIWKSIRPGETIAVFEEDAYINLVSARRMRLLSLDMSRVPHPWDIVLLESGHNLLATGEWANYGELASACLYNTSDTLHKCTWFGTRGYLLTHRGAQHLLRFVFPISVQIDSLISLVAAFTPDFHMYWTRKDIAHLRLLHITKVWDACFKCYMPTSPIPYSILIVAALVYTFVKMKGLWAEIVLIKQHEASME
jgi:GR25 family glycosyltransferase involved in LPS biosynthesis